MEYKINMMSISVRVWWDETLSHPTPCDPPLTPEERGCVELAVDKNVVLFVRQGKNWSLFENVHLQQCLNTFVPGCSFLVERCSGMGSNPIQVPQIFQVLQLIQFCSRFQLCCLLTVSPIKNPCLLVATRNFSKYAHFPGITSSLAVFKAFS